MLARQSVKSCFRYHKGTDFQANHNSAASTNAGVACCFRYHKGTDFQANHNRKGDVPLAGVVVLDTTKVQIFKQITTSIDKRNNSFALF